jgi:hypothetical protein
MTELGGTPVGTSKIVVGIMLLGTDEIGTTITIVGVGDTGDGGETTVLGKIDDGTAATIDDGTSVVWK